MKKNKRFFRTFCLLTILLSFSTFCLASSKINADYSIKAYTNAKFQKITDSINFETFEDLNLGFFKGYIWIKLEVANGNKPNSLIFVNNDFINRNYRCYKRDTSLNRFHPITFIEDTLRQDARTFDFIHPNFQLDLAKNEKATFLVSTYNDGRWIDATPRLMEMDEFLSYSKQNFIEGIVFFTVLLLLLIFNIYQWTLVKHKIYVHYLFYMFATFLMYFGLDGHLYFFDLEHQTIDHIVFLLVRLWIFSLLIYTSKFLEIKAIAPRFLMFLKVSLFLIFGITTLYQFLYFDTSVQRLHFLENSLSFFWLLLILIMVVFARFKRQKQLRYYSLPLFALLLFMLIGLIDGHLKLLPGTPFLYIRMGTLVEFFGFTYFIARFVKQRVNIVHVAEDVADQRKEQHNLSDQTEEKVKSEEQMYRIRKTDLVAVLKLLENSFSNDSDWEEFKTKFKEISPLFFEKLMKVHPNLSKSELRLLTLLKIGYTQKQIANILSIEPNSVKKSKHRTRQKLCLPKSLYLKDYLLEF